MSVQHSRKRWLRHSAYFEKKKKEKSFLRLNYPVVSTEKWKVSRALISHQSWAKYLRCHGFTAAHTFWVRLFQTSFSESSRGFLTSTVNLALDTRGVHQWVKYLWRCCPLFKYKNNAILKESPQERTSPETSLMNFHIGQRKPIF